MNDNPIATAAIVVGGGVTVGPIAAAYFALPVALAAEMLAPTQSTSLSLLSISYFYLGGNNLVTSVASRDILPNEAALADLPKVSTVI
jgi:hypothetical protein